MEEDFVGLQVCGGKTRMSKINESVSVASVSVKGGRGQGIEWACVLHFLIWEED